MSELPKSDMTAIMQTPEVQRAIADAAGKAAAAAVAEMMKSGATPSPAGDDATRNLFSQMALQIAEISAQGTNRKRVAPEVLASRANSAKECTRVLENIIENVAKARRAGNKEQEQVWTPRYRVVAKTYLNEQLIEPYRRDPSTKKMVPQVIRWFGMPNEGMRPVNEVAQSIYGPYKASIGSVDRPTAADTRQWWATASGRVVKGDAPPRLVIEGEISAEPVGSAAQNFSTELAIEDNNDPSAPTINVLGTVAAPARRNMADQAFASVR